MQERGLRMVKDIASSFTKLTMFLVIFSTASQATTERVHVKIIQRQNNETGYSGYVPGHSYSTSNANVDCSSYGNTVNCSGTGHSSGITTAPREVSYNVTGATFSLLLSDGRVAVVNCVSKYKPKGDYVNRRSCRMPITDEIDVEFKGRNAKLYWPVSVDGKKMESETYTILGVLDK
jgi:hypothetical protein